jgi:hypothetical protein
MIFIFWLGGFGGFRRGILDIGSFCSFAPIKMFDKIQKEIIRVWRGNLFPNS